MKFNTGLKWVNEDLWPTNINNSVFLINPLIANPTKWSNTFKQFLDKLPTICLNVFDHFVGLAFKGLKFILRIIRLVCQLLGWAYVTLCTIFYHLNNFEIVKNTHGGEFLLVKLQTEACDFTERTL